MFFEDYHKCDPSKDYHKSKENSLKCLCASVTLTLSLFRVLNSELSIQYTNTMFRSIRSFTTYTEGTTTTASGC